MKKNFFYTVLGLIGAMGSLLMGVVNAEVSAPYGHIEYVLNGNEHFEAQVITVTSGEDTITILDRNLGATAAGTGCLDSNKEGKCIGGDATYGYYFQWGNNYGFTGVGSLPSEQLSNSKVNSDEIGANYSSGVFHYGNINWINDNNKVDMWGGSYGDFRAQTVPNDIIDNKWIVNNGSDRQGPCPDGFHIPSQSEWFKLRYMGFSSSLLPDRLLIPYAGGREYSNASTNNSLGYSLHLWSSTPSAEFNLSSMSTTYAARQFQYRYPGDSNVVTPYFRANAYPIRCFYNEYKVYETSSNLNLIFVSENVEIGSGTVTENMTGSVPAAVTAAMSNLVNTGYIFSGSWSLSGEATAFDFENTPISGDWADASGNVYFFAQWKAETYTVIFDTNGGDALTPNTGSVTYNSAYGTLPIPTRNGYLFNGWYTASTNGTKIEASTIVSATGNHTLYAQWTRNQPSSGGGGGSKSTTNQTLKSDVKSETTTTGDAKVTTGDAEVMTGEIKKSDDDITTTPSNDSYENTVKTEIQNYSNEMQEAYKFAYENKITTMDSIEEANMEGPLSRIAMAKMLSYYAINVLGQKPDTSRQIKFNDVSEELDSQYDNGVTLAYQLGIMGINMPNNNFRPNDEVSRKEFGTALSRMLFKTEDGKEKYYTTHLEKLIEEKIMTNGDPELKELRGYIMIMLMRSVK